MSEAESDGDQTAEIMRELMLAERQQEITQASTLQGQIVALMVVLRDAGILSKDHIDQWERRSEEVASILSRMARANEIRNSESEEDPEEQLSAMLDGAEATLEFTRLMGNTEETLQPLIEHRDELKKMLEELGDES